MQTYLRGFVILNLIISVANVFLLSGGPLLLLLLLLPELLVGAAATAGEGEAGEDQLPVPGSRVHHPGHRHPLLHQQVGGIPHALHLDELSLVFRRVPVAPRSQFDCIGPSTIFRISLSFLCLFGLMLVLMLFRSRISMVAN